MTNETLEGNKLIAEFMGGDTKNIINGVMLHEYPSTHETRRLFHFDDLHYNYLWDWLMPVVGKIHSIVNNGHKVLDKEAYLWCQIMDAIVSVNIDGSHLSVYNYIKWYNQQNPKP